MIQQLLEIPDYIYQLEYLEMSTVTKRLPKDEMLILIQEVDRYVDIIVKSGFRIDNPYEFIEKETINFVENDNPISTEGYVEFAYFMHPNTISINTVLFNDVFTDEIISSVISYNKCKEILINHELYHYLEHRYSNNFVDIRKRNDFRYIVKRRYQSVVSELAAMRFSKIISEIEYSPYILNILLLLNINPKLSQEKTERVLKLHKGVIK